MKKNYTLLLLLVITLATNAQELINDHSFEGYAIGDLLNGNNPYSPAKNYPKFIVNDGEGDGLWKAEIIDDASVANTGDKCLKVTFTNVPDAPTNNYNLAFIALSDGLSLEQGATYVVSYFVKTSATIQASTIRVANSNWGSDNSDGNKLWHGGAAVSNPVDTWRKIEFEYVDYGWDTDNAVGVSVQPIVKPEQLTTAGGTIYLYIDDMSIVKKVATDIEKGESNKTSVFVSGKTLIVKGATDTKNSIEMFSINGSKVLQEEFVGSEYTQSLNLPKGLYLVKLGASTTKVMVQ